MSVAVRLQKITVRFGAVTALAGVDLEVQAGTLHAVVGENGAGKTTLMRVLYGAQKPTEGSVEVFDESRQFSQSADAIAVGVGMVSQHYAIIPELTCLQNLMLGAEGGFAPDLRAAEVRAQALAERMGFQFDWHQSAATLGPAGAQKLEILKLLWREAKVMILDEPTAMLSPADGEALFKSLRKLVDEGATVILVTHRLLEVTEHCSHVTVLRAGERVVDLPVAETDTTGLATLIVGGGLPPKPELERSFELGEPVLAVADLVVRGHRGNEAVAGITFDIRAGEVVGIAGVDGNGQRELFHALVGELKADRGTIRFAQDDATGWSAHRRIEAGLRLIPEDRHEEGVIEGWSLEENSALGLQRLSPISKGGRLDLRAIHTWAEEVAKRFKTRHGGLNLPMASLSGGNQQRFVAARALGLGAKVLLAFSPARGLDLKGTADVYAAIREQARQGIGALVVSFDLDELLEHCDRIVVLSDGKLRIPSERSRDGIGREMVTA